MNALLQRFSTIKTKGLLNLLKKILVLCTAPYTGSTIYDVATQLNFVFYHCFLLPPPPFFCCLHFFLLVYAKNITETLLQILCQSLMDHSWRNIALGVLYKII